MTQELNFPSSSGQPQSGQLALPPGSGPAPALIVVHEWFGLNEQVKQLCDRFASHGFLTLAVDLYEGQVADRADQALALVNKLKTATAIEVIEGAVAALRQQPRFAGKVGITGFCLGGAMALAAGCNVPGLAAILPFYGLPLPQYSDWSRLTAPVQGHFASVDAHVPREKVLAVLANIVAAGGQAEIFFYDGGHAFMREGDPTTYHAESAELAWPRALTFLHQHLD
jgi:carboxymethylenebutenolidase